MTAAALQYALAMPLEPSYAEEDFLVSESNHEAHALVTTPALAVGIIAISGPKGAGKTHLAHIYASRYDTRFVALDEIGRMTADRILGTAAALVVEDVERCRADEGLAQLINEVHARGRRMLLTSGVRLSGMTTERPDLASRLRAAHEVAIVAPDDILLKALLMKGFADRQIRVGEEVLQYIEKRVERSAASVQQLVERLDMRAMACRQPITLPMVRDVLGAME